MIRIEYTAFRLAPAISSASSATPTTRRSSVCRHIGSTSCPGSRRPLGRRRRLERVGGNHSTDASDAVALNFGWPCYGGHAAPAGLRQPEPADLRDALRAEQRRDGTVLPLPALRPGDPGRVVHRAVTRRSPGCRSPSTAAAPTQPSTTAHCSSATTRLDVSGRWSAAAPQGRAGRTSRASSEPREPHRPADGSRRQSSRSTSAAARSAASSTPLAPIGPPVAVAGWRT